MAPFALWASVSHVTEFSTHTTLTPVIIHVTHVQSVVFQLLHIRESQVRKANLIYLKGYSNTMGIKVCLTWRGWGHLCLVT